MVLHMAIFDNLKQYGTSANTSNASITSDYEVAWVDGFNVSYMRNYNMNAGTISASRMKPLGMGGKYGTIGLGLNFFYYVVKMHLRINGYFNIIWIQCTLYKFYTIIRLNYALCDDIFTITINLFQW